LHPVPFLSHFLILLGRLIPAFSHSLNTSRCRVGDVIFHQTSCFSDFTSPAGRASELIVHTGLPRGMLAS
jgi:hypothetical protein